ncbi:MAG: hypothetical protein V3V14_02170 [Saprospiraceae bacterium]
MNTKEIKYLILFILVITSQILFSQENKFSLTVEYSPNYSRLTNQVVNEKFKLSHNALLRISYNTNGKIKPTIGIGFLNTGESESIEIGGQLGIESIKSIHNFNYLYIPIGAKINVGKLYLLPELGIGINISNKKKQITEFTNGETEKETNDEQLNFGEFNKISIPISLSVGTDFTIGNKSFSSGLKGSYGFRSSCKRCS